MNIPFQQSLQIIVESALQEDIGAGDFSTLSCIPPNQTGIAQLKVKQDCIIAGVEVASFIFKYLEPQCTFKAFLQDGCFATNGAIAFEVEASIHTILKGERLVLNCMQRMSGISTLTNQYTTLLKPYKTKLLDTRKTTPNFRLLEKEAVKIGGGVNHRMGLYDMIMLKDNHIDFCGGIVNAVNKAYNYVKDHQLNLKIEVETRSIQDVQLILDNCFDKVDRIMLDNFSVETTYQAVALINGKIETESSGGIHLNNIEGYAQTGVDFVSVGGLIHQAQSVDLSLKAKIF